MATPILPRLLVVAMLTTLFGCGGGDAPPDEQIRPQVRFTDPSCSATLQLFGDSTLDSELGASPYWIAKWGSRVSNRAVGGTNSRELIAGTDGLNPPWPQAVSAKYVVVNHGLRDGYVVLPETFTPMDQYIANLRTLANAAGAEVIFQTPNPSTKAGRDMAPYAQAMRDVAAERGLRVIDVFACFQHQPNWQSRLPDQTHPDADGLRYIVDTCVAPVIETLTCE